MSKGTGARCWIHCHSLAELSSFSLTNGQPDASEREGCRGADGGWWWWKGNSWGRCLGPAVCVAFHGWHTYPHVCNWAVLRTVSPQPRSSVCTDIFMEILSTPAMVMLVGPTENASYSINNTKYWKRKKNQFKFTCTCFGILFCLSSTEQMLTCSALWYLVRWIPVAQSPVCVRSWPQSGQQRWSTAVSHWCGENTNVWQWYGTNSNSTAKETVRHHFSDFSSHVCSHLSRTKEDERILASLSPSDLLKKG